jgi:hypothetical protein
VLFAILPTLPDFENFEQTSNFFFVLFWYRIGSNVLTITRQSSA